MQNVVFLMTAAACNWTTTHAVRHSRRAGFDLPAATWENKPVFHYKDIQSYFCLSLWQDTQDRGRNKEKKMESGRSYCHPPTQRVNWPAGGHWFSL